MPLAKIFKTGLILFLALVGALISILAVLVVWICLNPQSTWKLAEQYFLPNDLKITWQSLEINLEKVPNKWVWQSQLKIYDILITKKDPHFSAAIDLISLKILASLFSDDAPLKVQDLQIISESPITFWRANENTNEENNPENEKSIYQSTQILLQYLMKAKKVAFIEKAKINLDQITYVAVDPAATPLKLKISIEKEESISKPILFSFGIDDLVSQLTQIKVNGVIALLSYGSDKPFLSGKIEGVGTPLRFMFPFDVIFNQEMLTIQSDAEFNFKIDQKTLAAFPKIRGSLTSNQAELQILTSVSGLPEPIEKLDNVKANFTLPLNPDTPWSAMPMKLDIAAPVEIPFISKKNRESLEQTCDCILPKYLFSKIDGTVQFENLLQPQKQRKTIADLELNAEIIENKLFSLSLGAKINISRDFDQFYYKPSLNSEFKTTRFRAISKLMDSSGVLIPAPLNVMDGFLSLSAKGPVDTKYEGDKLFATITKIDAVANLSSKNQKAQLTSAAIIQVASDFKRIDIASKSQIENLTIELPPLDPIIGIPNVFRDSRILMIPMKIKQPPTVKIYLDFEVQTAKPGAIKLLSKFVDPYVPISVKIQKPNSQAVSGFVQIEAFKIEYLRRVLFVDSLKIDFKESANNDFPIEGDFHVNQTSYKILIHVGGTINEPKIQFSSDPYLDRDDIISVLLYDRPRSQLVGGDAETAGNVQAAVADKAIGLFGLWAFANTPIQSFSYNPITKVYSASFQLGNGLTAGVGTAADREASLELRKRISKRWILTASWVPKEDQGQTESVVLQWEKRF